MGEIMNHVNDITWNINDITLKSEYGVGALLFQCCILKEYHKNKYEVYH